MSSKAEATFLGLGAMGVALAAACAKSKSVAVWNRTAAKATAFAEEHPGSIACSTVAEAIASSPISIFVVGDYKTAKDLLESPGAVEAVKGKTVVLLPTGTPAGAKEMDKWCQEHGASYLDGKLLFYPESAGTPDASTPIGGSESVYQAHSALLSTFLAPDYLGPNVSGPAALDLAQLCMTLGGLVGTIHGARICEAEGLDVGKFATKLGDLGKILVPEFQGIAKRIQDNEFGDTHASLEVYHDAGARVGEAANDAKLEMPWLFTMIKFMKSGVDMGIGKEDMAAAVKVLRK